MFLGLNVFGASVASYAAWTLDSAAARASDSGPDGDLIVLFFISLPVMACLLANLIAFRHDGRDDVQAPPLRARDAVRRHYFAVARRVHSRPTIEMSVDRVSCRAPSCTLAGVGRIVQLRRFIDALSPITGNPAGCRRARVVICWVVKRRDAAGALQRL
ncbi:MAG TPA: hypothetical protein VER12_03340 [Polyangiaceae bacterium]|nr:hypothetical protein [Polyangiaceae bacterium]